MNLPFALADSPADIGKIGTHLALLPSGVKGKDELLEQLARILAFPDYQGGNWDALDESLRDLSWINEHRVVLFHESLPELDRAGLETYLEILIDAVHDWRADEENELVVVFPTTAREILNEHGPGEEN